MQNAFKSIFKPTLITSVGLAVLLTLGCAAKGYRFANTKPVLHMDDIRPIPVPASTEYDPIRYYFNSMVRLPVHKTLGGAPSKLAGDVNALDQVPASSWYTPRLGYHFLSPDQLLAGPIEHGPPQKPVTVVKAKIGGGNPGFIVSDLRGILYLIKFDPPSAPALETTTALIVSRLFWGFGYNVPEDYLFYFRPEDLHIAPDSELTRDDIQTILGLVASPILGRYRSTASRFIEGTILGPIAATGVRQDDPNDTIPHQDRRVMRALRVFAAFTNHSDIRPDNTLDAYVGPKDQGHVRHYLLDFGEAFGGHGMEHQRLWDGYTFMFSLKEIGRAHV